MSTESESPIPQSSESTPELDALAQQLDRLGRAERSAAPPELDARLVEATSPEIRRANAPAPFPFPSSSALWRAAAIVAIVAGISIISALLLRSAPTATTALPEIADVEQEIDELLTITESWGLEVDSTVASGSPLAGNAFWGDPLEDAILMEDSL